jgi:hypothetical protein
MPKPSSKLSIRRRGAELAVDVEAGGGPPIAVVAPLGAVVIVLLRRLP